MGRGGSGALQFTGTVLHVGLEQLGPNVVGHPHAAVHHSHLEGRVGWKGEGSGVRLTARKADDLDERQPPAEQSGFMYRPPFCPTDVGPVMAGVRRHDGGSPTPRPDFFPRGFPEFSRRLDGDQESFTWSLFGFKGLAAANLVGIPCGFIKPGLSFLWPQLIGWL